MIAYLEAENAYTNAVMQPTETLQAELYDEMLARIKEDDSRPPVQRGDWYYYSRTEQGKAYPMFCRRKGSPDAPEQVYFDQNEAAKGHDYYQLGGLAVSPDHRHLALLVDTSGYEDFALQVLDLETRDWLPDRIEKIGFGSPGRATIARCSIPPPMRRIGVMKCGATHFGPSVPPTCRCTATTTRATTSASDERGTGCLSIS